MACPVKPSVLWKVTLLASVALISATVPDSVSVAVPLAPALMMAEPARVTATVPLVTESWVVTVPVPASTSAIEMPEIAVSVLENAVGTAASDGMVLTGASSWPTTFTVAVATVLASVPSVTWMSKCRSPSAGFSLELLYCTALMAVS